MNIQIHTYKHTYMHPSIHTYIPTYVHAYIHAHVHIRIHAHLHTHTAACLPGGMYYVCMHACMFICIYIHIDACRYTPGPASKFVTAACPESGRSIRPWPCSRPHTSASYRFRTSRAANWRESPRAARRVFAASSTPPDADTHTLSVASWLEVLVHRGLHASHELLEAKARTATLTQRIHKRACSTWRANLCPGLAGEGRQGGPGHLRAMLAPARAAVPQRGCFHA